ncbi:NAD(P)-binding protein [Ramaria rubella]|nr:NAD(P)-binding protein [Ramaria rubella]
MTTLTNKTILIFGGSSGIGYGVAEAALTSGASLVIIASSSATRIGQAVQRFEAQGKGKVRGEIVDVTDRSALKTFVTGVGEVDHIVWTSGEFFVWGFPHVDAEKLQGLFDTRFWGPVVVAQNAKIRAGGSFTLTTGAATVKPPKSGSMVAGMLGAVDSLVRGLAVDLAPIRVNAVSPGLHVCEQFWKDVPEARQKEVMANEAAKLLVKHVADASEIAEAYLFLMKCSYITGQCIQVDGGHTLV